MKCDFCSTGEASRKRLKEYLCADFHTAAFDVPGYTTVSQASWMACPICSDLIDRGEFDTLVQRALDTFIERHGREFPPDVQEKMRKEIGPCIRSTYELFFQNRKGIAQA